MANKLQNTILIIADEIDRICRECDIQYSMFGGTLLGAIRHHGFIPWDDDFDICMKRNEYNRFIKACETYLDKDKYELQTIQSPRYAFAFAKIRLNGTRITEEFSKSVDINHGIFVDVFPCDNIPDDKVVRKTYMLKNHILKNIMWVKLKYGTKKMKNTPSYYLFKILGCFITEKRLKEIRIRHILKCNEINYRECISSDYPKYILKNEWFEDLTCYEFESRKFSGFNNYDACLKMMYGDYMVLPPEGSRRVHTTNTIDYGEY